MELANSIVKLLEILFPKTIDKMKKETSALDGPKPILLDSSKEIFLKQMLEGKVYYQASNQENQIHKNQLEFGCSQVILVKNSESKKFIPKFLENALCLTILEAKVN